jgi:hypothetical protein
MKWIATAIVSTLAMIAVAEESRADMQVACVADDIWAVSYRQALDGLRQANQMIPPYAKLYGTQLADPQSRFRFSDGKVYWKNPDQAEYMYGDLQQISPTRFQSGASEDMTIIFDEKFETAIITVVSGFQTTVYSTKCIAGK